MGKYRFCEEQRIALEKLQMPFAVYQFLDNRVVTILLSDGFCSLFGYDDREKACFDMDNDMYKDTHPDDVARIADEAYRFAVKGGKYEAIYRSKQKGTAEYNIIHAQGDHVYMEDGTRLSHIWYTLEGTYSAKGSVQGLELDRAMASALHEESLLHANSYDDLTGLPRMTYFFDLAEAGRAAMLEKGKSSVLLFLDLTGLKFFNQEYGFAEGNNILKEFARILAGIFSNENCGRFGQDHFAVYTWEDGIGERLERLFEQASKMNGGNTLPVRVGIYPDRMEDVNISTACDRAKAACDELRGTYASGFRYYDETLDEEVELRNYIINNIDRALEERWIQVWYQPIVRAVSGKVCDDEALSRWFDPEKGLVPPSRFIPVLEDAGLVWKLDLYVADRVLETVKQFREMGYYMVPHSINLSRSDFHACDIVEEIRKKTDEAGISRDLLTIEITESSIGEDYDFMKRQIERFRELGFQVWLDDFGSGYSSLNMLQDIRFDLIKFDMQFMRHFNEGDSAGIILNELMKMASSLGVDTVCEGVETEEQVRFLKEIGCSKLQGFYYDRPIPPEELVRRHETALKIGIENPEEAVYYDAIGRVNLHDIGSVGRTVEGGIHSLLGGLPMAVIEIRNDRIRYARLNRHYAEFMKRCFGYDMPADEQGFAPGPEGDGAPFMNILRRCCAEDDTEYFNETMPDGSGIHALFRRIAVDPVTETTAVAVAVLSITDAGDITTYETFARVLSSDYSNLFYVDLQTEEFVEYTSPQGGDELSVEHHGKNFFEEVRRVTGTRIYKEDIPLFEAGFNRENILKKIRENGTFSLTYRQNGESVPVYVSLNAALDHREGHHLIIGTRNVDEQMKQREALESIRREQVVFSRITALSGEYLGLYAVDPETEHYYIYGSSKEYERLGLSDAGKDFFHQARLDGRKFVCAEDLPMFLRFFSKENVMREIRENGIFVLTYGITMNRMRIPVCLRIARVEESDGEKLIVGLNRSNDQMLLEARGKDRHVLETAPDAKASIDYQYFADCVNMPCCIMSVEKKGEDGYGMIRIEKANHAYKRAMGPDYYYDGVPYYEFVPQNDQFEEFCCRSALRGERVHAYVESRPLGCWIDETLIPLESDREGIGYCQFIYEATEEAEAARIASVSVRNAEEIIKASMKLLGSEDLHDSVSAVLEDVLEISGAEGTRIMLVDHENEEAVVFSECFRENAWPERKNTEADDIITYDLINTWADALETDNILIIRNEADMYEVEKKAPIWVMSMRTFNVYNLILIPLRSRKKQIGYLYVVNFDPLKEMETKELLEMLAFYFSSEIFNHLLMQKMEKISELDALTGLYNRRAMKKCVDRLEKKNGSVSFGVITIDLNGLKVVNDRDGHEAGDRLLLTAAALLRRAFRKDDLFRIGGDEFLVIAEGISKELFEKKIGTLRHLIDGESEVSLALGACWSDGAETVSEALRESDERMYRDKKEYYERHPEKRR